MKRIAATLIFSAFLPFLAIGQSVNSVPDSIEFNALKDIYHALDGDQWTNKSGWPPLNNWPDSATSVEFGTWHGITVNNGDVTAIILSYNNLNGLLPQSIVNLVKLKQLDFNSNNISGGIPTDIGNLIELNRLRLPNNPIGGPVPESIGNLQQLNHLALSNAKLTGPLPDTIGSLILLKELYLHQNSFNDSIPQFLCNLTNLVHLYIPRAGLNGTIPSCLGNLVKLQSLSFEYNQLSGTIPPELGNLPDLSTFYLNNNNLEGPLPATFSNLTKLTTLSLRDNKLNGSFPEYVKNFTNLQNLYLANNNFSNFPDFRGVAHAGNLNVSINNNYIAQSELDNNIDVFNTYNYYPQKYGSVPDSIEFAVLKDFYLQLDGYNWINKSGWPTGNWPDSATSEEMNNWHGITVIDGDIEEIFLGSNNLTGTIPIVLQSLIDLKKLSLTYNNLSGQIPVEIFNLYKLESLNLYNNQLIDTLPGQIKNLSHLISLELGYNQLSGSIPPSIGELENLQFLYMRDNQFAGNLPPDIGGLTNLKSIDLRNNFLSDSIPEEFGNLKKLETLNLMGNNLTGINSSIGSMVSLKTILLHSNQLKGEIPESICNLTNLELLFLPYNQLSGKLPSCINQLQKLTTLSLQHNGLSDSLPLEIGQIQSLKAIHLYLNQFSGPIPVSIGSLTELRTLDLGKNNFSGDIPDTLANLNQLTNLNLSDNQDLSGLISQNLWNSPAFYSLSATNTKIGGIPDFTDHPNKVNIKIYANNAALSPNEIEKNLNTDGSPKIAQFDFSNQKYVGPQNFIFSLQDTFKINAVDKGSYGTVVWERYDTGTNSWANIDSVNESSDSQYFIKSSFTNQESGKYRFTITHPWISDYSSGTLEVLINEGIMYAIKSGNWSDNATWSYYAGGPGINLIPSVSEKVRIEGFTVTVDSDIACDELILTPHSVNETILEIKDQLTVSGDFKIIEKPNSAKCEAVISQKGKLNVN